jgi:hypothetical protein
MASIPPYQRDVLAYVKLGVLRKDIIRTPNTFGLNSITPTMLSTVETYCAGGFIFGSNPSSTSYVDFIFQPASMDDATFAKSIPHAEQMRRQGLWPLPNERDIVRAMSPPYLGPEVHSYDPEVSALSKDAREKLQVLKIGMTRRQLSPDFERGHGMMHPPTEIYLVRGAHAPGRNDDVSVDVDFKPVEMDDRTFADPKARTAWYRDHAWWPGLNPDDTMVSFGRPRLVSGSGPVIPPEHLAKADLQDLMTLRVGVTRKEVMQRFGRGGGLRIPTGPFSLPNSRIPGLPGSARKFVAVEIDFQPSAQGPAKRNDKFRFKGKNTLNPGEDDTDVVAGFSQPFASSSLLDID